MRKFASRTLHETEDKFSRVKDEGKFSNGGKNIAHGDGVSIFSISCVRELKIPEY